LEVSLPIGILTDLPSIRSLKQEKLPQPNGVWA